MGFSVVMFEPVPEQAIGQFFQRQPPEPAGQLPAAAGGRPRLRGLPLADRPGQGPLLIGRLGRHRAAGVEGEPVDAKCFLAA